MVSYVGAASALCMCGLAWFVQVVHYPLFASVGDAAFAEYHELHTRRTGWIVAPLMIAELLSAGILALQRGNGLAWSGAALVATTWALTFALAVPQHSQLSRSFAGPVLRRLVRVNLVRALVWSAHGIVALALIHR